MGIPTKFTTNAMRQKLTVTDRGPQLFQKSKRYFKILDAGRVTKKPFNI